MFNYKGQYDKLWKERRESMALFDDLTKKR